MCFIITRDHWAKLKLEIVIVRVQVLWGIGGASEAGGLFAIESQNDGVDVILHL